jgi:ribosomal protein S18 acetylase RimI-like enzyme
MKIITQALSEDAATILELQKLAFMGEAQLHGNLNIPPLTQTLEELSTDFNHKIFWKAQIRGEIVGSVRGYQQENTCYVERLITHPDYQRQGIGTMLMARIESYFELVQRFELFTAHKSDRNIRFYEQLGYQLFKSEKITDTLSFVFMEKYQ